MKFTSTAKFFALLGLIFYGFGAFSQSLYMPRNIENAYQKQTRDLSGQPGENYWQNGATYHIKIKVAPPDRRVDGSEKIVYTNNSPDTLQKLNFKLIINHHKPGSPRSQAVPESYLTSGIHIDKFLENGKTADWGERPTDGTDKFIKLQTPLLPGQKITLDIDWHYDMSKQSGREGAISPQTFFAGYFYPRVAVYDDYVGWDRMPHILSQEFYNDFNNYTLEVTTPKNFIVWGTGDLQNPDEVLSKEAAKRFNNSKTSDETIHVATQKDLDNHKVTKQNKTNTWKFKANNVTDIAFAVSNEYKWDASSVKLSNGKRVSAQSAYDKKSKDFEHMTDFIKHAVKWFSENFPGVIYPYSKMTVVRGFADMEFPMMANDSSMPDNPEFTRFVAEHEIAHTYFPFYMGTNETRFGFMDEGWATTMEYLVGVEDLGQEDADSFYRRFRVNRWIDDPDFSSDLPIIIPTNMLSGIAMGNNEYGKASLAYLALRDLLGPDTFKKTLKEYMNRWKGKHPMPWDFFYSFNDITGQNLNWFWNNWFFSRNYIDYDIKKVTQSGNRTIIQMENIGGFPTPFDLVVTYADGQKEKFHQTPEIWHQNSKKTQVILKTDRAVEKIVVDGGIFKDADFSDNTWEK